jgi:hypothetical protein
MIIREWQRTEEVLEEELKAFQASNPDKKTEGVDFAKTDFCKNHLKLMETFCMDDKTFTCWMCHHFNYSEKHRGHKVVSMEEAYRRLR